MSGVPDDAPAGRLRLFVVDRLRTRRVQVEPAGPEGEIALLRIPDAALDRLLAPGSREAIVERARAEGFRYAALDLALPVSPPRPEDPRRSGLA